MNDSTHQAADVSPTEEEGIDPLAPIDGVALPTYVDVCRDLVRTAGDSPSRIKEVLARRGLTPEDWGLIRAAWSERIRRHPEARDEFQRRFAGQSKDAIPDE